MHVRMEPEISGQKADAVLNPGDVFKISQGREGADGILYLKLADGTGWVFDRTPQGYVMCVEYRSGSTTPAPYNCEIIYPGCEESWSFEQRQWCCNQNGRGCLQPSLLGGGTVAEWNPTTAKSSIP